jgi:glyoxylase-like metal-dependent hydrolase (beta-lactamase superfamily II)
MPAQPAPVSSIAIGDIRLTYLPDGHARMSPTAIFPTSDEQLWNAHPEYLDEDHRIVVTFGGFLVETGDRKLVVDLGFGVGELTLPELDATAEGGRLLDSLHGIGVEPAEVDTVVYTHLHFDHVGWTSTQGRLTFPNARHVAGAGEWDFWRGVTDEHLAGVGPHPETVQAPLEGRMESMADGEVLAPGVNAVATPGHTPGHCSLVISSGTDRAVIMGDTVMCPLQFQERDLTFLFDVDPDLALRTRRKMFDEIEGDPRTVVAGGHYADAVFGRVLPGQGNRWERFENARR